jgi:hypothetical protein
MNARIVLLQQYRCLNTLNHSPREFDSPSGAPSSKDERNGSGARNLNDPRETLQNCRKQRRCRHLAPEKRLTYSDTQVNVPKTRRTYCKGQGCKKHTQHKVTQYKAGKVNIPPFSSTFKLSADMNRSGLIIRTRKATIRSQAVRIWWSDETGVQKEGKDNQEGRVEIGVHSMQNQSTAGVEAMQAFRTRVRETRDEQRGALANMLLQW